MTRLRAKKRWSALLLPATALLGAACGGDDGGAAVSTTASPTPTSTATSGSAATTSSAPPSSAPPSVDGTVATDAVRGPGPAPLTFPEGMGSTAADGVFPRTIGHHKGDTVLDHEPARIVTIGTGQTDVLLTLGIVPVGAVARKGAETVQPYLATAYPDVADAIAAVEPVGTNSDVNFEAIAALQPDLILDNGGAEAETYDQLAAIAPTVITAGTGVNWKQDFRLIASAVGRSDVAAAVMADYDEAAGELATQLAGDRPTASFVRFNTGRARMFGVPSFVGSIAWDAGLDRPATQQFDSTSQDLSEELIGQVDADWLFYSIQGAAADTPAASYLTNPLWENLASVAAGHVTVVEDDPWYLSAGPTAAQIVLDGLIATFGAT